MFNENFYNEESITTPSNRIKMYLKNHRKQPKIHDTVIISFGYNMKAIVGVLRNLGAESHQFLDYRYNIYNFEYNDKKISMVMLPEAGSPIAAAYTEELIYMGAKNIILFGSVGSLKKVPKHYIYIPTEAIRGEGTSKYYIRDNEKALSDKESIDSFTQYLDKLSIAYNKTKVYTTDAIYRETKSLIDLIKNEYGATCIDMEASSIFSVCMMHKVKAFAVLYAGDYVSENGWEKLNELSENEKDKYDGNTKILAKHEIFNIILNWF